MVKSLRKRHLQIWSMLLVLLPAGIISAKLATRKAPAQTLLQPAPGTSFPVIVHRAETPAYTATIRKASDSLFQLEWINKRPLTVPTCNVYGLPAASIQINNAELIGRIEAMGTYRFVLNHGIDHIHHLVLYDFIHGKAVDSVFFR